MSEEKVKKSIFKKWWFWVIVVIVVIAAASGGEDSDTTVNTTIDEQSTQSTSTEVQNEPAAEQNQEASQETVKKYKSGTYIIGQDIEPGLYKSEGSITYWARLNDFTGELGDIKANGNPMKATELVEITSDDKGFETRGSGYWIKLDESYKGELLTTFGDGTYIVGNDIQPGTYKSEGTVIYWARLSAFTGDLGDIKANGNPMDASTIVKILPDDIGFTTRGGGTWTKID